LRGGEAATGNGGGGFDMRRNAKEPRYGIFGFAHPVASVPFMCDKAESYSRAKRLAKEIGNTPGVQKTVISNNRTGKPAQVLLWPMYLPEMK
jgi:hypothetical protein